MAYYQLDGYPWISHFILSSQMREWPHLSIISKSIKMTCRTRKGLNHNTNLRNLELSESLNRTSICKGTPSVTKGKKGRNSLGWYCKTIEMKKNFQAFMRETVRETHWVLVLQFRVGMKLYCTWGCPGHYPAWALEKQI